MTPIREIIQAAMLKLVLRAERRDLERRIQLDRFDKGLSARLDAITFLLDEQGHDRDN